MAKASWIEREKKKRETVKKYAALRAEFEGEEGLRRVGQTASQRQSSTDRKPLPNVRTAAWLFAGNWLLPIDVPRSRVGTDLIPE